MDKLGLFSLVLTLCGLTFASKCPEPRKPHATSCTIFYNCVNLPGGGYVWVPAKCTNGLVFQPYLRICVLPGDSWTCDILATDAPETTTNQIPELINPTLTSYLAYGEDDASKFSEPIDSYYKSDTFQQTVTPYPLIEVTSPDNYQANQIDSDIHNIGLPIAIKHSEDNYLYRFVNGQQVLATPLHANNEELQAHLQRLTQLMERLVAYQSLGIPLDRQPQQTITTTSSTTRSPPQFVNGYNSNRVSGDSQDSAILSFLIKNYVLKAQAESQTQSTPEIQTLRTTTVKNEETSTAADSLDLVLNSPGAADNIVVVRDSLGNRQYFTISKYKSITHQLTTETVELIPCTSGVRLANSSDCTKYYRCEPETAKIRQFSCPSHTAFNQNKRLCERAEYIICTADPNESTLKISATTHRPKPRDALNDSSDTNPCQTLGKHGDPTSESHYYLCYSNNSKSTDLQFQRMVCPTSLVFCQTKSLCTLRQRCNSL